MVGGAIAAAPDWTRRNGTGIVHNVSGPWQPEFAILVLADGSRRVAGIACRDPGNSPDGTIATTRACRPSAMDMYRVGNTPGD